MRGGDLEVLIITSRKGSRWVLPKGIVEPGMTAAASAAKEAMEEAGVEGRVVAQSLGKYGYRKWGGTCEVEVFPMEVTTQRTEWPESTFRRREWVSLEEAVKRLDHDKLRKLLRRLPDALEELAGAEPASTALGKPPRVVYLFRHAKSSWEDPTLADLDRPLAPRGRHACETMGRYMRFADVRPDVVLCSPSVRTRQTIEKLLPALDGEVPVAYEEALYHGGPDDLMDRLRRVPDKFNSVLIVGHNPALQALAVSLAGAGDPDDMARLRAKFPTAGMAMLVLREGHWRDLAPDLCELHSFVVPRELA
jgi:phosphohistidine phosphatase